MKTDLNATPSKPQARPVDKPLAWGTGRQTAKLVDRTTGTRHANEVKRLKVIYDQRPLLDVTKHQRKQ
jgi:hypothetical protein